MIVRVAVMLLCFVKIGVTAVGQATFDVDSYSLVHPGLPWVEIQPAAVEKDRKFEVFSIAVPS